MKKLLLPLLVTLIGGSVFTSSSAFAQEVFGQDDTPNSLSPTVEIGYDDLPEKVRVVINKSEFGKHQLENVYEVGTRTGQRQVHYTVRFRDGEELHDIYVDDEGNIIDPQDSDEPK